VSVGWCNTYEGRKVSRVAMCEVRSRKNGKEQNKKKEKKSTVVSNKKKSTVMSPIRRRMKKRNPSSGQNGQLVHWWLLIHSGHVLRPIQLLALMNRLKKFVNGPGNNMKHTQLRTNVLFYFSVGSIFWSKIWAPYLP